MLPLLFDANTEVIIFGSYPGELSLAKQEYYGNPGNHFWRIMSSLLGENLVAMGYDERLQALLRHKVGLWDTYGSVERKGSLDSAIRNAKMNEFGRLKEVPRLRLVAFNGTSSGKGAASVAALGFPTVVLPSSSAAHAISLNEKTELWKKALGIT